MSRQTAQNYSLRGAIGLESLTTLDDYFPTLSLRREMSHLGMDISLIGNNDPLVTKGSVSLRELDYFFALARPTKKASTAIRTMRLRNFFAQTKPDFFFTVWVLPDMLKEAKRAGCKTVIWTIDGWPLEGHNKNQWFDYLREFDYVLAPSKAGVRNCKENGISNVEWLPFFCDPSTYVPAEERDKSFDISFIGSYHPDRRVSMNRILLPLITKFGKRVHLFGFELEKIPQSSNASRHNFLKRSQLASVYSRTKIAVNIHRDPALQSSLNLNERTFEILGAGQFELIDAIPDIDQLFKPGVDLVVAHDEKEAVELAEYYINNVEERRKIAESGYRKVTTYHTIRQRAESINSILRRL
jgi:spore maturation protein CgeB